MSNKQAHWEHFDHEADIGVRGIGRSLVEAFEQAALALTAVVCDPEEIEPKSSVSITCENEDPELLFVDWLNCLVYEMAIRKMLFSRFEVEIHDNKLSATAWGEAVDIKRHQPAVEIKGTTYTALHVGQNDAGQWIAETVVDV